MTEIDVAIEFDLCRSEVIVVVAACKFSHEFQEAHQARNWSYAESNRHVQWCDVGSNDDQYDEHMQKSWSLAQSGQAKTDQLGNSPNAEIETEDELSIPSVSKKATDRSGYLDCEDHVDIKEQMYNDDLILVNEKTVTKDLFVDDNLVLLEQQDHKNLTSTHKKTFAEKPTSNNSQTNQTNRSGLNKTNSSQQSVSSEESTQNEWEEDENPWLGCICGTTHKKPISVFWIQCDACDAWYNCGENCVGFSEQEAQKRDQWQCPDCSSVVEDSPMKYYDLDNTRVSTDSFITPKEKGYTDEEAVEIFAAGTIVEVLDRTWVGSNKPGGIAKVLANRIEEDEVLYDVQYVLESRKEFNVEAEFVKINAGVSSPANGTRSLRNRASTSV